MEVAFFAVLSPVCVALLAILAVSRIKEPGRQNLMALLLSGGGAAYLNGGLGIWEFVFSALMTLIAYQGLRSYRWIAIGWLLHTGWDILHHLYGNPIIPFDVQSSLGCAICDPLIALWCWMGCPTVSLPRKQGASS